jgi:tetratricopeptide (TPR) repeat protein
MSVLYKALQKAEKENELRQSASADSGFDTERLAASGALKTGRSRGRTLNRAVLGAIVILAVGGGAAFLLLKDSLLPQTAAPALPTVQVASAPPAAAPADEPMLQPPAQGEAAAPAIASAAAPAPAEPVEDSAETKVAAAPPEPERAPATAAKPDAAKPAARERQEAMPSIPVNSPARMLSPPISISRSEFALAGVGDQVQVREVSQSARSNVAAGYEALVRGSYDMALAFYESALKEEPGSVLANLGRGAALQKLGRGQEAQASYDAVLKSDPDNREALTNITSILGERAPQEALTRLLELERQYAMFSPVKAQIGLTYAKMGSHAQALDYFRRAVMLSPDTIMYHYNLALVLDHLGRRDQAVASYERVLASISAGRSPVELSATEIERRVRFLRGR